MALVPYGKREGRWESEDNLSKDYGWGISAFEGAADLVPKNQKVLKNKIISAGLMCRSGGNIYVFLPSMNYWSVFCSPQSVVFLNTILGNDNATVNYNGALVPFIDFIERETSDFVARDVPPSICIGTQRLRVLHNVSGLTFRQCEGLLDYPTGTKAILAPVCIMPLNIRIWPKSWVRTNQYPMYKQVAPLFVDPVDLKTIEWSLGHAMLDPHSYSKTVVLYGEGGNGKTILMAAVDAAFSGACGSIPEGILSGIRTTVPIEISATIASKRIVTGGDVGRSSTGTNLNIIKALTGHDYIVVGPARVKTACTLMYGTNSLDDPIENVDWCTPAVMRRIVVVTMSVNLPENYPSHTPQDPVSRLDFALRCVHTRLMHPYMPISPLTTLTTLMGSRFAQVTKMIGYAEDASDEEVVEANAIVAAALCLEIEKVGSLARRISLNAVVEIKSIYYVRGIVRVI